MMGCLDEERVFGLVHGGLAGAELEGARAHLGECAACRVLVAEAARSGESASVDVDVDETSLDETPYPPIGELAEGDLVDGKYRIQGRLGRGGMGIVYAALHVSLKLDVAIKVLHSSMLPRKDVVARFQREARAAARIKSPHVVSVLDVGELPNGEPFIVMERLEGNDLAKELRARGHLPVREAVDYAIDVCEAAAEAHAIGVVHRDLKPANLFLCKLPGVLPSVKTLDFGISKISNRGRDSAPDFSTEVHAWLGTPRYMAPEQITLGRKVDERADIWAIGTILYELLCGHPPFEDRSLEVLCKRLLEEPPPPLSGEAEQKIPSGLEVIVARCLEKSPERRFRTVGALARALERYGSSSKESTLRRIAVLPGMAAEASETLPTTAASRTPRRAIAVAAAFVAVSAASILLYRMAASPSVRATEAHESSYAPPSVEAPPAAEAPRPTAAPSAAQSLPPAPTSSDDDVLRSGDRAPAPAGSAATRHPTRTAPLPTAKHPEFGGRL